MDDDWTRIDRVLQAALECPPEERDSFLQRVCAGDTTLESEVRSLLASYEQAGSFLEEPAIQTAARALAGEHGSLSEAGTGRLENGSRLGDYTILAPLGSGGMGEVYRARDPRLRRDVAIKVLRSFVSADPDRLGRFEQEAQAAAQLNHPNILAVFQLGSDNGAPYLVSELLEGRTLREDLQRGPMPLRRVVDCGVQIASGLAAAHDRGIVHRDLKPENLFVTNDGRVKILDFGLAKLVEHAAPAIDGNAPTVAAAESGMVMGTVGYMSPEQVSGENADHRTDIFALGAVLYEMLTGNRAFRKATSVATMNAILHEDPPEVSRFAPMVSPALQRLIGRCLEKNPERRFQSASDLGFALEGLSELTPASASAGVRSGAHRLRWAAAVVVLLAMSVGAGWFFAGRRLPALTEKDSIVLADFTNTTGDPVFDGTLRQGLSVQLQQTPFLQLLSADQIRQSLRLMEKAPDVRLTHDIAREVCQRAGATVEVDGSIAALGSQYVIGLNAIDCRTGSTLAEEQGIAKSKDDVLAALASAASGLREKLGESQASLDSHDVPLPQATTASLEALQAFARAGVELNLFKFPSAASHLERAVSLDPDFAVAHGVLGTLYAFLGRSNLAAEEVTKAYALRDRVSDFERLFITANYHLWGTGDLERTVQAALLWTRRYPRDATTWAHLSYEYRLLGRSDESLAAALESLRLDPAVAPTYTAPFLAYVRQGRLDLALANVREAEQRHLGLPSPQGLYMIAFVGRDEAGMAEQLPRLGPLRSAFESRAAAYRGKLALSRDLMANAIAVATQSHADERVAVLEAYSALIEALFGDVAGARRTAILATGSGAGWDASANAALALAIAGDGPRARAIAARLHDQQPENTFVQFYYLPAIRAAIALRDGKPADAVQYLRAAASYDLAMNEVSSVSPSMIPVYLRGEAFLAAHRGPEAVAEFQKILDHPGTVLDFAVGALAHLGIGRAYALAGESSKAHMAYRDFLTLWKDADADIPLLRQARAEEARLP